MCSKKTIMGKFINWGKELISRMRIRLPNKNGTGTGSPSSGSDPDPSSQTAEVAALYRKRLFTEYFRQNYWRNEESVSGPGSTIEYTENIRKELPRLLERFKIRRILDAPCGDYNWFQAMNCPQGMEYTGGDIVEELIEQNQLKYGSERTSFITLDITTDSLPQADLWLCRDCLFHFSYVDIFKALANLLRSDIQYLLTSVHPDCTLNTDITTGGARQLNLELPPFRLCQPLLYIDDWIPGYTVRRMGLWSRSMIADSLASSPDSEKRSSPEALR
jgi:hypothetical protein